MNKGELVPDDLVLEIAEARLTEKTASTASTGWVPQDGIPGGTLDKFLNERDLSIDKVLDIRVDKEELMTRLIGRRVCRSCGASYHVINMPPEKEGICDVCGGELYQRSDDTAATVENRIGVYSGLTVPLVEYYEKAGKVAHIDGGTGLDKVFSDIVTAIGDRE